MSKWNISFAYSKTNKGLGALSGDIWRNASLAMEAVRLADRDRCRRCEYVHGGSLQYRECEAPHEPHIVILDKNDYRQDALFHQATHTQLTHQWAGRTHSALVIWCDDTNYHPCAAHSDRCATAEALVNCYPSQFGLLKYDFMVPHAGFGSDRTCGICAHFPQWVEQSFKQASVATGTAWMLAVAVLLAEDPVTGQPHPRFRDEFPAYIWASRAIHHAMEGAFDPISFRAILEEVDDCKKSLTILPAMRDFVNTWSHNDWPEPFNAVATNTGRLYEMTGQAVMDLWNNIRTRFMESTNSKLTFSKRLTTAVAGFVEHLSRLDEFKEYLRIYSSLLWRHPPTPVIEPPFLPATWLAESFASYCTGSGVWKDRLRVFTLWLELQLPANWSISSERDILIAHANDFSSVVFKLATESHSIESASGANDTKQLLESRIRKYVFGGVRNRLLKITPTMADIYDNWRARGGTSL